MTSAAQRLALGAMLVFAACDAPGRGTPADGSLADAPVPDLAAQDLAQADRAIDLALADSAPGDGAPGSDGPQATAPNSTCSMAKVVIDGTMLTGENAAAGVDSLAGPCRHGAKGGVLYYQVTIPASGTLTVIASPTGPWDAVVRLLSACGASTCLGFADNSPAGVPETLTYGNASSSPATLILAVGSYTAGVTGAFDLSISAPTPPANAQCAMSKAVVNGTVLPSENSALGYDTAPTAACDPFALGPVLYYTATVPPGDGIGFSVTPTGATPGPMVVRQLTGCGATTCTYADNGSGAVDTSTFSNTGAIPVKLIFAVGSADTTQAATYSVAVTIVPLPVNVSCATAKPVVDGTVLMNEDPSTAVDDLSGSCLSASGGVLYYQTTIPVGKTLTAIAAPTPKLDVTIRALSACGAMSCLASADQHGDGIAETLVYTNPGSTPLPIILAVGPFSSPSTGTFTLSIALTSSPANARCAMAKTVIKGTVLNNEDPTEAFDDLSSACGSGSGGVLYYKATLAAGATLTATATPTAALNLTVRALSACGATNCLASAAGNGAGGVETLIYANSGTATVTVLLAVGGQSMPSSGTFNLSVDITAPPANTKCSLATTIVNGTHLATQNQSGGVDKLNAACQSFATGPVLYYKATIPAGKTLTALAAPTGPAWDLVLRLLNGCGAATCLGSADNGAAGVDETLTYTNSGAAAVTVILAVGSFSPTNTGTFDLDVKIQ